jgi:hypothetical protein
MACACSLGGGEEANADEHNADSENSDVDESDLFRPPETFVAASQMKPEQYERKVQHDITGQCCSVAYNPRRRSIEKTTHCNRLPNGLMSTACFQARSRLLTTIC